MKQKSHAACVVGRESVPNYLLKKIVGTWLPEEEEQEEEEQRYLHDLKQKTKTQRSRFPWHSQLYTKFPDTMYATLIGTLAVLIFCQLNMIT